VAVAWVLHVRLTRDPKSALGGDAWRECHFNPWCACDDTDQQILDATVKWDPVGRSAADVQLHATF
jgi:hypothetical protein